MLSCVDPLKLKINGEADIEEMNLEYKDENSGEYECVDPNDESESHKIYVKFRSESRAVASFSVSFGHSKLDITICVCVACDNCVELDLVSLTGIAMGSLVATILIGVAVYQTASHSGSNVIGSSSKTPAPYSRSTASIYTFKLTHRCI